MRLSVKPWPEIASYLKTNRTIIVPIGSTEQHGPTGPLGTDAICAQAVAERLGELAGVLVGPTISVGVALHHLSFPGTISLRPSTLLLVVKDYVHSLVHHGFRTFFFINGHGGNVATVNASFAEIYHEMEALHPGEVRCILRNWYDQPRVARRVEALFGSLEGSHASVSEISLTQLVHPESVRTDPNQEAAPNDGFPIFGATDFRRRFPDGRIGSLPRLASPEVGRELLEAAVADLREALEKYA